MRSLLVLVLLAIRAAHHPLAEGFQTFIVMLRSCEFGDCSIGIDYAFSSK